MHVSGEGRTNPFHDVGRCELTKHSVVLDDVSIGRIIRELFIIRGSSEI